MKLEPQAEVNFYKIQQLTNKHKQRALVASHLGKKHQDLVCSSTAECSRAPQVDPAATELVDKLEVTGEVGGWVGDVGLYGVGGLG